MCKFIPIRFVKKGYDLPFFDEKKTIKWITQIIKNHKKSIGEISFFFCNNSEMVKYNKQYFSHSYPTDIITINQVVGEIISAEIFVGIDTIQKNAEYYKVDFNEELSRIIIHGIFHLLGYNDNTENEQEEMRLLENKALKLLDQMS